MFYILDALIYLINYISCRPKPQLTTDVPDKDGNCKKCKQAYKDISLVYINSNKKWLEVLLHVTCITVNNLLWTYTHSYSQN